MLAVQNFDSMSVGDSPSIITTGIALPHAESGIWSGDSFLRKPAEIIDLSNEHSRKQKLPSPLLETIIVTHEIRKAGKGLETLTVIETFKGNTGITPYSSLMLPQSYGMAIPTNPSTVLFFDPRQVLPYIFIEQALLEKADVRLEHRDDRIVLLAGGNDEDSDSNIVEILEVGKDAAHTEGVIYEPTYTNPGMRYQAQPMKSSYVARTFSQIMPFIMQRQDNIPFHMPPGYNASGVSVATQVDIDLQRHPAVFNPELNFATDYQGYNLGRTIEIEHPYLSINKPSKKQAESILLIAANENNKPKNTSRRDYTGNFANSRQNNPAIINYLPKDGTIPRLSVVLTQHSPSIVFGYDNKQAERAQDNLDLYMIVAQSMPEATAVPHQSRELYIPLKSDLEGRITKKAENMQVRASGTIAGVNLDSLFDGDYDRHTGLTLVLPSTVDTGNHPVDTYQPPAPANNDNSLVRNLFTDKNRKIAKDAYFIFEDREISDEDLIQGKSYLDVIRDLLIKAGYNVSIQEATYFDTEIQDYVKGKILVNNDNPEIFYEALINGKFPGYDNGDEGNPLTKKAEKGDYLSAIERRRDMERIESLVFDKNDSRKKEFCDCESDRVKSDEYKGMTYGNAMNHILALKGYTQGEIDEIYSSGALTMTRQNDKRNRGGQRVFRNQMIDSKKYATFEYSIDRSNITLDKAAE